MLARASAGAFSERGRRGEEEELCFASFGRRELDDGGVNLSGARGRHVCGLDRGGASGNEHASLADERESALLPSPPSFSFAAPIDRSASTHTNARTHTYSSATSSSHHHHHTAHTAHKREREREGGHSICSSSSETLSADCSDPPCGKSPSDVAPADGGGARAGRRARAAPASGGGAGVGRGG